MSSGRPLEVLADDLFIAGLTHTDVRNGHIERTNEPFLPAVCAHFVTVRVHIKSLLCGVFAGGVVAVSAQEVQ